MLIYTQTSHPAIFVANDMAHQHNAALRGLNAIYLQAPYVVEHRDIRDLLFLMRCWGVWAHYYDGHRRNHIFPRLEEALQKPGFISSRLKQEWDFIPHLDLLLNFVRDTHSRLETYNPLKVQELLQELGTILRAHLAGLISILTDLPRACGQLDSEEAAWRADGIPQIYRALEKEASDAMDPNIVPPMLMRMRDTTYQGGNDWPGLPPVALHTIADRLSKTHAGAWRFLPCDVWGRPKELLFLRQEDPKRKGGQLATIPVPKIPPKSPRRALAHHLSMPDVTDHRI
jgi:hypothetical protein